MSDNVKDLETAEKVETLKDTGDAKSAETKSVKSYTKEEYELGKERTAKAVEDRLTKDFNAKFEELNKKVFRQEALEVFRTLNGNEEKLDAVMKLGNINYGSETIKDDMIKTLEQHPEFRKQNTQPEQTPKREKNFMEEFVEKNFIK